MGAINIQSLWPSARGPTALPTSSFCYFSFFESLCLPTGTAQTSSLSLVIWGGLNFSRWRCEFRGAGLQVRIPAKHWRPKPLNQIHKKVSVPAWMSRVCFLTSSSPLMISRTNEGRRSLKRAAGHCEQIRLELFVNYFWHFLFPIVKNKTTGPICSRLH